MAGKRVLALNLGLILLLSSSGLFSFARSESVSASLDKLEWSVVDTPSEESNMVISPGEINAFVVGADDETCRIRGKSLTEVNL